jgi:isocitrate dehydrogenase
MKTHQITLIPGDGIGPEVTAATRRIMEAAGVRIDWQEVAAGASVFRKGIASGVPRETIDSISQTRLVLKGPLETPVGFGEKSANVTLRKLFETYGNIRPVRMLAGVPSAYRGRPIDLVIVRENVEDLYAGIEHQQTPGVAQCLKLISRKGCEKIVRLAFEAARAQGRKSVACATKANIMKLTEGLLKRTFEELAPEYSDIEAYHIIVDNCAHQLVKKPEQFDVIVTTNMNGDILSDLTSALVGGLGFAGSANLGSEVAIFEAVHGSAPKYAGKDVINPTAMIFSGLMMLRHIGEFDAARTIEEAIEVTLAEGINLPRDVVGDAQAGGTTAYTDTIIANFGRRLPDSSTREHRPIRMPQFKPDPVYVRPRERSVVGFDLFTEFDGQPEALGPILEKACMGLGCHLKMISSRGTMVYPSSGAMTDYVDHWRCRFLLTNPAADLNDGILTNLLRALENTGVRWMHVEKLQQFDGSPGFTKAQGED